MLIRLLILRPKLRVLMQIFSLKILEQLKMFEDKYRYLILIISTACLSMMLSNILTLNFTILCMTEEKFEYEHFAIKLEGKLLLKNLISSDINFYDMNLTDNSILLEKILNNQEKLGLNPDIWGHSRSEVSLFLNLPCFLVGYTIQHFPRECCSREN